MVFFTADTHFDHELMLKMEHRPFESVDQMNQAMIDNWNAVVKPDDTIYHLGDFAWKRQKHFAEQLQGNVILIGGNHDQSNVKKTGWQIMADFRGMIEGTYFHLYHYPILQWDRSHVGSIHLHGHVHGALRWLPTRAIDVGVDVWDFKPVSLPEILQANQAKLTGERFMCDRNQRKA